MCVTIDISQNTGINLEHVTKTLNLLRLASNKDTGSAVCLSVCYTHFMCSTLSFSVISVFVYYIVLVYYQKYFHF